MIVIAIEPTIARRRIILVRINHIECELYITEPVLLMSVKGANEASQELWVVTASTRSSYSTVEDTLNELNIDRILPVFLIGIALFKK